MALDEFGGELLEQPVDKKAEAGTDEFGGVLLETNSGPSMAAPQETSYTFSTDGLRSFGLRTKLGFADGPKEKLDILRSNGVDARLVGNEIHYLDPKTREAKLVDEPGFSVYDIADLVGEVPEFVGMTLGGTIGGVVGSASGPAGTAGGGALGASIGGMAGAKARTDMARMFGADISYAEEFDRVKDAGVSGLIGDPTGRVVARIAQKVLAPSANKLVHGFKEANEVLGGFKDARGRPLRLTPAEGTTSGAMDMLENVAEGSFFGRGPLRDLGTLKQSAMDGAVKDIVTSISRGNYTKEEYGLLVQDAILKKGQTFRALENKVWGEVDKLSPDVNVDVSKVRQWAIDQLSRTKQARAEAPSIAGKKGDPVVDILSDISTMSDNVSFSTAHEWISNLAAMTRKGPGQVLNSKQSGILKELNMQLNGSVDEAGRTLKGNDLVSAYKTARNFTKDWRQVFDNKLTNALANSDPQKVAEIMFKPNNIENLRAARSAMGPAAFQKVKGAWVGNMLAPDGMAVSGSGIGKRLAKWDDPTLREILDKPGEMLQFQNLVKAIELSQGKVAAGTPGKMAVQLAQPGALIYLAQNVARGKASGADSAVAAAVVLAPAVIGKVFASPTGAKWLTEGFKAPAGTEAASRAASAIVALAMKDAKGNSLEGIQFLSEQEAKRLEEKAVKAKRHERALENKKEGIPLTRDQEEALNRDYPGASRMSFDDLSRIESYTK